MKQFLRSFLTLLMLVVWASGFAQDTETIDLTKQGFENATVVSEVTGTDVKLSFAKGGNTNNGPTYYTADKTVRLYVNNTLTISSTTKEIAQIVFTLVPDDKAIEPDTKSFSTGSYSASTHTWTGKTNKIILTQKTSKKQFRIQKLVITFVKEGPSKTATTLTFPKTAISINGGDEASFKGQSAKLYAGEQELADKTIEYAYTTGDDIFATFDRTTGAATLKSGVYGTATVTATYAGDDTYEKAEASYTVTVKNPNVFETAYDFVNNSYGYTRKDYLKEGDIISNKTPVIIINTKNGSTNTRFWDNDFRNYQNAVLTIKSDEGFIITKITMTGANINQLNLNDGNGSWTKTEEDGVWSGSSQSISFTNPGSKQDNKVIIKTIEIEYASTITTLDESKDNTETISNNNGKTIDIKLTRTLVADKWNTFCVPFETEIAGTALDGATVKTIGTVVGNVINLVDATKIEAGVPYLVMPTTGDIVNPTFKSVTITEISAKEAGNTDYKFVGTYSPKTITVDEFGKIWGVTAEGKLAKINANTTMKGLRAYFVFPVNVAAKLNFDGETTGINNIETNAAVNGKVYNLNGQYVGNSLNGLKKGIYVVNGKKVIK